MAIPHRVEYTQTRSVAPSLAHLRNQRIIAGLEHDQRAESYRQLRTQILRKLRENQWRTLAVTSPNNRAGKTLTALNLAISLSLEVNQTVLLVDLDLRHPSILEKLGIDAEYGLMDYLEGRAELSDVMINPGYERLVVLPSLPGSYRSEILSSPQMADLLREIVNRYESRLIIFDLPALLNDDDALVFAPFADATLLVVEDGISKRLDIERSLQLLEGTRLIGTVLNKVR
jgi:Mrp family chromosome partitioning ATPase